MILVVEGVEAVVKGVNVVCEVGEKDRKEGG